MSYFEFANFQENVFQRVQTPNEVTKIPSTKESFLVFMILVVKAPKGATNTEPRSKANTSSHWISLVENMIEKKSDAGIFNMEVSVS